MAQASDVQITIDSSGVVSRIASRAAWDQTTSEIYTRQPLDQSLQSFQSYQMSQKDTVTVSEVPSTIKYNPLPDAVAEKPVGVALEASQMMTVRSNGKIVDTSGVVAKTPYLAFKVLEPLGSSGTPALVMLDVDIEASSAFEVNPDESYTFDVSGLLTAATVLTGMNVNRGLNYRRVSIGFIGILLNVVFPEKTVKLKFNLYHANPTGVVGNSFLATMTATVFGQEVLNTLVSVPRPMPPMRLAVGDQPADTNPGPYEFIPDHTVAPM